MAKGVDPAAPCVADCPPGVAGPATLRWLVSVTWPPVLLTGVVVGDGPADADGVAVAPPAGVGLPWAVAVDAGVADWSAEGGTEAGMTGDAVAGAGVLVGVLVGVAVLWLGGDGVGVAVEGAGVAVVAGVAVGVGDGVVVSVGVGVGVASAAVVASVAVACPAGVDAVGVAACVETVAAGVAAPEGVGLCVGLGWGGSAMTVVVDAGVGEGVAAVVGLPTKPRAGMGVGDDVGDAVVVAVAVAVGVVVALPGVGVGGGVVVTGSDFCVYSSCAAVLPVTCMSTASQLMPWGLM